MTGAGGVAAGGGGWKGLGDAGRAAGATSGNGAGAGGWNGLGAAAGTWPGLGGTGGAGGGNGLGGGAAGGNGAADGGSGPGGAAGAVGCSTANASVGSGPREGGAGADGPAVAGWCGTGGAAGGGAWNGANAGSCFATGGTYAVPTSGPWSGRVGFGGGRTMPSITSMGSTTPGPGSCWGNGKAGRWSCRGAAGMPEGGIPAGAPGMPDGFRPSTSSMLSSRPLMPASGSCPGRGIGGAAGGAFTGSRSTNGSGPFAREPPGNIASGSSFDCGGHACSATAIGAGATAISLVSSR